MMAVSPPVSHQDIVTAKDKTMKDLSACIKEQFPNTRAELPKHLRNLLTVSVGVIFMGDSIVIPDTDTPKMRILDTLYSFHQGTTSMRLMSEQMLYWPSMARDIASRRQSCQS